MQQKYLVVVVSPYGIQFLIDCWAFGGTGDAGHLVMVGRSPTLCKLRRGLRPSLKLPERFAKRMIPTGRPTLGAEELNAIREVLESGMVVQGPKVAAFERMFAQYTAVPNAVAV